MKIVLGAGIQKLAFATSYPGLAKLTEKTADWLPSFNQEDRGWGGAARDNALAAGAGLGVQVGGGVVALKSLGPWHTPETVNSAQSHETAQIIKDWLQSKRITPTALSGAQNNFAYSPNSFEKADMLKRHGGAFAMSGVQKQPYGYTRNVLFSARQDPSILMHEAGHSANFRSIWRAFAKLTGDKKKAHQLATKFITLRLPLASRAAMLGAGIGMFADKEKGDKAWALPLLGGIPLVAEEGTASIRGLNALRKAKGLGAALRGTPRLAGALGSYAAIPLGGALAAYLANRFKPN